LYSCELDGSVSEVVFISMIYRTVYYRIG